MTNPQTEARAIVPHEMTRAVYNAVKDNIRDYTDFNQVYEDIHRALSGPFATALAAKDAELVKANMLACANAQDAADESERAERAEAQLAEVDAHRRKVLAENERLLNGFIEKERQLAEANKALEPFAKYASENGFGLNHKGEPLPDADGVGWVYLTNGDFRAARRALTGGQEE